MCSNKVFKYIFYFLVLTLSCSWNLLSDPSAPVASEQSVAGQSTIEQSPIEQSITQESPAEESPREESRAAMGQTLQLPRSRPTSAHRPSAQRSSWLKTEPPAPQTEEPEEEEPAEEFPRKAINSIHISGNKQLSKEAILARIPYRTGDLFIPQKTGDLIRNLYALNYFNTITVEIEDLTDTTLDLYITVEEKKKVESITYEGNPHLTVDEIEKKLKLCEIPAMDDEELFLYADQIKKMYAEKNYHAVTITPKLVPTENGTYKAIFSVCEGNKAVVKRVFFKGNNCISSRKLRNNIFTREDWLFGFVNKAGSFQPEMLDFDKFVIENFYQSNGFLAARVVDVQVDIEPVSQCITVTYVIEEGDLYTVKCVSAPGNELLTEEQLLTCIPLRPGTLYSKELIRQTMEVLRNVWGRFGYIYADIEPVIIPNFEEKTVDITFNVDLGNKIYLNRIGIMGNCKTRDYVIRRMLTVCEGQLLSTPGMELSKSRVEGLGYFEPQNGVEWKITKVSEDLVDLDLMLKEIKTGRIDGQLGYGGADPQSPNTSFRVGVGISDRNLFGTGIRANVNASWSRQDHGFMLNFFQPWLFGRPIGGGAGVYHKKSIYEDFKNISDAPRETLTGGDAQLMFLLPYCNDVSASVTGGVENIHFQRGLIAERADRSEKQNELLQTFIDRRFISGTAGWIGTVIGQDMRNHPQFPNRGYNWSFATKFGIPAPGSCFGYVKGDFDTTWLTPLIGDYDLVFLLHGHAGFVKPLGDKAIPYRELYNMGGPGTVRGFEFGQIGPQIFNSSVGAQKAFWVNAELIFSVTKDQSIRGVLFYDGGAGWDTPLTKREVNLLSEPVNALALTNNRFRYRHAIGFGIRLTNPAPIRIDWGFKLDRNKRLREKFYEVHFNMSQEF